MPVDPRESKGVVVDLGKAKIERGGGAEATREAIIEAERLKRFRWRQRKVELRQADGKTAGELRIPGDSSRTG